MRDNEKKRQYLTCVTEKINHKQAKSEIACELDVHIDERAQFYEEIGYTEEEAFEKAVEQMGDSDEVGISLAKLHPTDNAPFTVASLILLGFLIVSFCLYMFFNVDDGKLTLFCEAPLLLCFLGLSFFAHNERNLLLSRLLPLLFLCVYGWYLFFVLYRGFYSICSPFVLALSCVLTGDFVCLGTFWRVGDITVSPWLTFTSIAFYIFVFLILVSVAVSVKKLNQPYYSLFDKRAGKALKETEKYICLALVLLIPISLLPFRAASRQLGLSRSMSFEYVVVLQSDSPCTLADVPHEDVCICRPDYDFSRYLFAFLSDGAFYGMSGSEENTVPCGSKIQYMVRKHNIEITASKPYVSIYFVKYNEFLDKAFVYQTLDEFLPPDLEWQPSDTVETVSRVYDAYNTVAVVISAAN